jgi:hypothetical protein
VPCGCFRSFLSLIPLRLPAQPSPEEDLVADWRAKLQRQEERLRRQEWKAVAKDSRDLVAEMVDRLLIGEASVAMLALAVGQQAVAELGLGHREEAVWLLHLAQNLDARYRDVTLGSYGAVGEALERFRLRPLGAASAAWPKLPAEGSFEPPRVLRQKEPETPGALARARVLADVEVEMVVVGPARASGTAVPALFRTRISHERLQKAAEASSSDWFSWNPCA